MDKIPFYLFLHMEIWHIMEIKNVLQIILFYVDYDRKSYPWIYSVYTNIFIVLLSLGLFVFLHFYFIPCYREKHIPVTPYQLFNLVSGWNIGVGNDLISSGISWK